MLSDGKARLSRTANLSATAKQAPEARDPKDDATGAAEPAAGATIGRSD